MGIVDFFGSLNQAISQYIPFLAVGLLAIGIFTSFWGARWLKITQAIQGFVSGFVIICAVSFYLNINTPKDAFITAFWGGIISIVLMLFSNPLAKFLMGAYGIGLVTGVGELAYISSLNPFVTLLGALLGGVLFIFIDDFMIIVAIVIAGAWSILTGVTLLTGMGWFNPFEIIVNPFNNLVINVTLVIGWVIITVSGILVQFKVTRRRKNNTSVEPEQELNSEPMPEEAPGLVAVKLDMGLDGPTEPLAFPGVKNKPFTSLQERLPADLEQLKPPEPSLPLPETEESKPGEGWVNPFFTDPFLTDEEDLEKDQGGPPPAVPPSYHG